VYEPTAKSSFFLTIWYNELEKRDIMSIRATSKAVLARWTACFSSVLFIFYLYWCESSLKDIDGRGKCRTDP
jgi:hypothetical protein